MPLAELVDSYQSGTPKRFRGQLTPKQTDNHDQLRPKVTCPKSPILKTGQRARSGREKVLSYKELEDKQVEEMKQYVIYVILILTAELCLAVTEFDKYFSSHSNIVVGT